jgi:hypothetical protein
MSDRSERFAGIRLKIKRAWQQLDGLGSDLQSFLNEDPYVPRVQFDGQTQMMTASVHIRKSPDPMWGVRIGEIVHNLRSALDHAVQETVILDTRRPPTTKQNQFPVFEHASGFGKRGVKKFLHDVGPAAISLIRSEQPFPKNDGGTGEGVKSPLWHLKELSDHDKHRTLHLTGTMVSEFKFTLPPLKRDAKVTTETLTGPGLLQEDVVLARAHFPGITDWPFETDKVNCELRTDIASIKERQRWVGGLSSQPS